MAYWPALKAVSPQMIRNSGVRAIEGKRVKRKLCIVVIGALALALGSPARAGRPDKNWKSWFGHFAGGYSSVLGSEPGEAGHVVDDGWNLNGGATFWPETWPVGLDLELAYNDLDIKTQVLQQLEGVDSATFTVWSTTADVMWGPGPGSTVNVYLMGGVGAYRAEGTVGQDVVYDGVECDPWSWWCTPGLLPGTVVLAEDKQTVFGYNFGAGITFRVGLGSQIYVEAKYHRAETDPAALEYIPVVLGYRW
jgi:opacity protein-like surface antigen